LPANLSQVGLGSMYRTIWLRPPSMKKEDHTLSLSGMMRSNFGRQCDAARLLQRRFASSLSPDPPRRVASEATATVSKAFLDETGCRWDRLLFSRTINPPRWEQRSAWSQSKWRALQCAGRGGCRVSVSHDRMRSMPRLILAQILRCSVNSDIKQRTFDLSC